jgi:methionyl-tRNA formyltransferase
LALPQGTVDFGLAFAAHAFILSVHREKSLVNLFVSGQGTFAVMVAEMLTKTGNRIVGTASPRTKRGRDPVGDDPNDWDRLRTWALRRTIQWVPAPDLRANFVPDDTDIIIAAHSHAFLGQATRARARVAAIGYHPSLLPLHRGRDAIRWTIRDGDRVTGGTVYHLTERTDGGSIAAQEHVLVPPNSNAESLWRDHLAPLGVALLARAVNDLAKGRRVEVRQDERLATWEPAMDVPPLFKPELIALPSRQATVDGSKWSLIDGGYRRDATFDEAPTFNEIVNEIAAEA